MSEWSLERLLQGLHGDIQRRLQAARELAGHPVVKGDASENVWRDLFEKYLPFRYQTLSAHVVDSEGAFSEQIDVVIVDRQYTPMIFNADGIRVVPAESVYAVFESKQAANAGVVKAAHDKVGSVRRLVRTSAAIPWAQGTMPKKAPTPILGGLLTFESDWSPALGQPFKEALEGATELERLDLGCVAAHGMFNEKNGALTFTETDKAATAFLFKLIARLQALGTVPMIDIEAYARWLAK